MGLSGGETIKSSSCFATSYMSINDLPAECRFQIEQGEGMWVGVTTDENFMWSYALKGLMYGGPGNLSSGGGLAQGGWGPTLKAGDTVDMKVNLVDNHLTVEFGRNGFYLGKAFDIEGWPLSGPLRPVVSLSGEGNSLTISKVTDMEEFPALVKVPAEDDINGEWQHDRIELSVMVRYSSRPSQDDRAVLNVYNLLSNFLIYFTKWRQLAARCLQGSATAIQQNLS